MRPTGDRGGVPDSSHYGPLTASAVRLTQEFMRIPVDGVYGPQTRAAMFWVVNDSSRTVCVNF
ncbi:peptidoglycan-binding domain-containing protein [Streptomyces venezuelae]|uniref:peptidoglycan-binding domain-containing protein n=1 Tax=Streptomyces gardneri TaxID=66892 RepID=UPI00099EE3F0|nr:peptidoglycan-binding domain-containing protein [Streptomyces gardneri]WRK35286.1 peptidoglycan-binding domain-containing protein [Streptomyces venezuelae]